MKAFWRNEIYINLNWHQEVHHHHHFSLIWATVNEYCFFTFCILKCLSIGLHFCKFYNYHAYWLVKNIIDSMFDDENTVKGSTSWKKNIWFLPNKKKPYFSLFFWILFASSQQNRTYEWCAWNAFWMIIKHR